MGGPDVDVGFGKGGEHRGGNSLPGSHLVPHSSQHAAVINLLDLADAARSYGLAKPVHMCPPSQAILHL